MILIFTGNGKGKTTAALGQAVRAIGSGKKVLMIQFIKGPWLSGEHNFFEGGRSGKVKRMEIIRTGKGFVKILGDKLPFKEHQEAAQEGLKLVAKAIKANGHDLIILDEINNAVDLKLVKAADVLKVLKSCNSSGANLILTGRNAPKSFIKIADIVTEMKEVRHIFNKNKKSAKKGIEF